MPANLVLGLAPKGEGNGDKLTYGSSSTVTTNAAPIGVNAFRLIATTDCYIDVGPSPVALSTSAKFLPAYMEHYRPCNMGDKVAVIQSSAAGTIHVEPVILGAA